MSLPNPGRLMLVVFALAFAAACSNPLARTKQDYLQSGDDHAAAGRNAEATIDLLP